MKKTLGFIIFIITFNNNFAQPINRYLVNFECCYNFDNPLKYNFGLGVNPSFVKEKNIKTYTITKEYNSKKADSIKTYLFSKIHYNSQKNTVSILIYNQNKQNTISSDYIYNNNLISEIWYKDNEKSQNFLKKFSYDENDNLIEEAIYTVKKSKKIIINKKEYLKNQLIKNTIYEPDGKTIKNYMVYMYYDNNMPRTTLFYNNQNMVIKLWNFDKLDSLKIPYRNNKDTVICRYSYYDSEGTITKTEYMINNYNELKKTVNIDSDKPEKNEIISYLVIQNNKYILDKTYNKNIIEDDITMMLNSSHFYNSVRMNDNNNHLELIIVYKVEKKKMNIEVGDMIYRKTYTYDSNNNIINEAIFDKQNTKLYSVKYSFEY